MILADTSIWIGLFRTGAYKAELDTLIANDQLCIHPFLIAVLALGTLPERRKTLHYLDQLISLRPVRLEDVRHMIEARGFASKGIGLTERAALIRAALKSLIAREAGRRLLALAGTAPNIEDVRRLRVDEQ